MLSDDFGNGLLNRTLRRDTETGNFDFPDSVYLALLTEIPKRDTQPPTGEIEIGTAPNLTGYGRQELSFGEAAEQMALNDEEVEFDDVTEDWTERNTDDVVESPIIAQAIMTTNGMGQSDSQKGKWIFAEEICPRIITAGKDPPVYRIKGIKVRFKFSECCIGSDYIVHKWLNAMLRGEDFNPPEKVYLALLKTMPISSDTELEEVSADNTGYERAEAVFSEAENQETENEEDVEFSRQTEDWATKDEPIVAVAAMTQPGSIGGDWLFAAELDCPIIVKKDDPDVIISAGKIKIGFDCCDC